MEGSNSKPLPEDKGAKKGMGKNTMILAVVVVIIIIAAGVGAALLLWNQPEEKSTPVISFTATPETAQPGDSILFNATNTSGEPDNYQWWFGDGIIADLAVPTGSHAYSYPGKYLVLLNATNSDKGAVNFASPVPVLINNQDPDAVPTNASLPYIVVIVSSQNVANNTLVTFDASGSYAFGWNGETVAGSSDNIKLMTWDFGDLNTESGNFTMKSKVNHTYLGVNTMFVAKLKVTSNSDAIQWYYLTIVMSSSGSTGETKTFVEMTAGGPDTLDPARDYETAGGEVLQNVYETLVFYEGNTSANLKPVLCTEVPTTANGGISADGLNYTFKIRQGVKFHNGDSLDAYDVEYSLERVLLINDYNGPAWMIGQAMISGYSNGADLNTTAIANSVVVVDQYTVTIKLVRTFGPFIFIMAHTLASIISKDFVEAHGGVVQGEENAYLNTHTCGTGSFKLVTWNIGSEVIMERFDQYWGVKPKLGLVFIKYVDDFNQRLLALQAGDADSIYVPRKSIDSVTSLPDLYISRGNATAQIDFLGMCFNFTKAPSGIEYGDIPTNFFSDVNVREAFAHAFNYTLYIQTQMKNTAIQPNGPIPKGYFGYDPDVPVYEFNLALAKSYLENATNPDTGNSWLEDGFSMTLYYNTGNTVRQGACQIMKEGMEALAPGKIDIQVQSLAWATFLNAQFESQLPMYALGWLPDYADPDNFANPFLHENGTYGGPNRLGNSTLTQMIDDAAFSPDLTVRANLYSNITWSAYNNVYGIWVDQPTNFWVFRDYVTGFMFNPMHNGRIFAQLDKNT
jgi:peptide/nickel transport system substrate-binding protein